MAVQSKASPTPSRRRGCAAHVGDSWRVLDGTRFSLCGRVALPCGLGGVTVRVGWRYRGGWVALPWGLGGVKQGVTHTRTNRAAGTRRRRPSPRAGRLGMAARLEVLQALFMRLGYPKAPSTPQKRRQRGSGGSAVLPSAGFSSRFGRYRQLPPSPRAKRGQYLVDIIASIMDVTMSFQVKKVICW